MLTRLTPPRQYARLLQRQRLDALLSEATDYPLTLLVAPAGSGKTMALAGFAIRSPYPVAWCRIVPDEEPFSFLCHLVAALRMAEIFDEPTCTRIISAGTPEQQKPARSFAPLTTLDTLVNELAAVLTSDTILILDDYHEADAQPILRQLIERLIAVKPTNLHILLSTRYRPLLNAMPIVHARGEIRYIEQHDLAFTGEEIKALFVLYEQPVPQKTHRLVTHCRGWPLVLQLLVSTQGKDAEESEGKQQEKPESSQSSVFDVLDMCRDALTPPLVEYLTQQVFDQQPPGVQNFLLHTAALRWFNSEICAALPDLAPIAPPQMIEEVWRRCLFVESLQDEKFIYQPLFRSYLVQQAIQRLPNWRDFHMQIAEYYRKRGDYEGVLYHLMTIREDEQVAAILEQVAASWIAQGRAMAMLKWLDRLPPLLQQGPPLLEARAAASRQLGRFEDAITFYQQTGAVFQREQDNGGLARTLRGQAEVYLDTVQPTPAAALLKQAMKLLPAEKYIERAEILLLQAENWINRGRADVAFLLETSANRLIRLGKQQEPDKEAKEPTTSPHPSETVSSLPPRLLLRSGRLNESRHMLEASLGVGSQAAPGKRPAILAHREPLLLLALLYALLGNGARAFAMALRGLLEAIQSGSQLTESIAHMRVGHAHQVITPIGEDSARQHYQQSLDLADALGISRTKVEGYMGLALLHGHGGDLVEAELVAREGLHIAKASGDEWIAALIWLALGGAAVVYGDKRALEWLDEALPRFVRGGDNYGQAVVALWRGLWYLRRGSEEQVSQQVAELLELTQNFGYEGLLTAPTLFGPRDMAMLIPLLLRGRSLSKYKTFAQQLLRQAFPTVATDESVEDYHPGYTLRIQMLGSFRVWRGTDEIQSREWQREKARQLLQLLLTHRGQWLQREQICAWLWPDSDLDAAERQFKVTLNALNTALEPFRPPRTTPFFVRRQGLAYSFAPSYGCWIDVDEFELRTTNVPQSDPDLVLRNAQTAINLYKGDYLAESLYDSWTLEERERLLARYLSTATSLSISLLENGDMQHAIEMCERVLRRDRCYEEAYQVLIRAYARSGSRSQALRSYARCVQALQDDLAIDPLPETTELYEQVKRNEDV